VTLAEIAYFPIKAGWICPGCEITHNRAAGCPICLSVAQLSLKVALDGPELPLERADGQSVTDLV
jgi:hypothetical protein